MEDKEASEPRAKKLRSTEEDLCIKVGCGDSVKEYHYVSQAMALQSDVIDTMLATPMKEGISREISFPDITPEMWDEMMRYLQPADARTLTVETAMTLLPLYDKYSFQGGIKCCDYVLAEVFEKNLVLCSAKENPNRELDTLIDMLMIAREHKLAKTVKSATEYFSAVLGFSHDYGNIMFTRNQIKRLAPLHSELKLFDWYEQWTDDMIASPCKYFASLGPWQLYRWSFLMVKIDSLTFKSVSRAFCSLRREQSKRRSSPQSSSGRQTLKLWQ